MTLFLGTGPSGMHCNEICLIVIISLEILYEVTGSGNVALNEIMQCTVYRGVSNLVHTGKYEVLCMYAT